MASLSAPSVTPTSAPRYPTTHLPGHSGPVSTNTSLPRRSMLLKNKHLERWIDWPQTPQFSTVRSHWASHPTRRPLTSWRPWTTRGRRCSSHRRCLKLPSTPAPSCPTCCLRWWLQGSTTLLPPRRCEAALRHSQAIKASSRENKKL